MILHRAAHLYQTWRRHHDLAPLWTTLNREMPDVAPWRSTPEITAGLQVHLDVALLRRIVAIREIQRALRPYTAELADADEEGALSRAEREARELAGAILRHRAREQPSAPAAPAAPARLDHDARDPVTEATHLALVGELLTKLLARAAASPQ